ncbi:uracil-xanthine permease family protein [Pseudoflavonifractor sp. MSJ-37]|uniref:uracil-xanthine permease family protein n=1 Tax=Pseudoflavonifractor sp. MSJ-37 TaxID=2841531 RepID=UPI001C0F8DB3|nr:solute carrier family 23 protein [Pseudoflavonifractor sp. MSJ-37]MBU5435335.1 purine/pyrimidine permease [Pseudoflavonifractor sp. MSJ-37]
MSKQNTQASEAALFQLNGRPPMSKALPLGFQHVVVAIVSTVSPALLVSGTANMAPDQKIMLVQVSLLMTAIAILLQLFPIVRGFGSGLPLIMGISFILPTLMIERFSFPVMMGAQIVGGIAGAVFAIFLRPIRKLFPTIVTGTVVLTIGMSMYPIAVRNMAGGYTDNFGTPAVWIVTLFTLVVVVICDNWGKGLIKLGAVLWGLIAGYILSIIFTETGIAHLVDFSNVGSAGWFSLPRPMQFGIEFDATACISMAILFVANSLQTIGDMSSLTVGGFDRMPTDRELSGGIMAQSVGSIVGAIFGGMPTCSYSECVGIVTVTKVVNKVVFAIAAFALLICGLVPKFASILTTVPECVLGGAVISVFAIITMTGVRMVTGSGKFTNRKATIVGLSVAVSIGITQVSGCMDGLPAVIETVFGSFAPVGAALIAIPLNLLLPKAQEDLDDEREQAELERKRMEALQAKQQ